MDIMFNNRQQEGTIEDIYSMNEIKVEKGFYTAFELKRKFNAADKRVILDSDFQREDVWNRQKKVELIESVMMGLPLPMFYFCQDKQGRLIVVDGRQRLTALFEFMDNKFPLQKMKIMKKYNGVKFSDLSPVMVSRIEDYQIQAHIIMPSTPDRIKFDIFDRVNRGGLQLNRQEIRNALYQGRATILLKRIVDSTVFENATGGAFLKEKRMKDKYLVNRFLVFYLYRNGWLLNGVNGERYVYQDDMEDFLGHGMNVLNQMDDGEIFSLEKMIEHTLGKVFVGMGEDAFRLSNEGRRTPINMNVFETVMYAYTFVSDNQQDLVGLGNDLTKLFAEKSFRENIGNHRDSSAKLKWRLDKAEELGRKYSRNDIKNTDC